MKNRKCNNVTLPCRRTLGSGLHQVETAIYVSKSETSCYSSVLDCKGAEVDVFDLNLRAFISKG